MAATRGPRAGGDDIGAVMPENITLGITTVAEGLALGGTETCADIPSVSPLIILLKQTKDSVDNAVNHQEELTKLHKLCGVMTGQVIGKYQATYSGFDVAPLQECIKELNTVAEYCGHDRSVISKSCSLQHSDRIQNLRERIDQLLSIMGLTSGGNNSNQLEAAVQMMVRAQNVWYGLTA